MKGFWRLLIAVVVLIGLGVIVFWPKKKSPDASAKPLLTFAANQVNRLQISQPGQPDVVVVRGDKGWTLQQPYTAAADAATIKAVLDTLNDITGTQDLGKESNLTAFGLDQPSKVQLSLATGKTLQFDFGGTAPASGDVYLQLKPGGEVYTAPSYVQQEVVKPAFDLQDKALLHFPESDVTGLTVREGHAAVRLQKTKDGWPKAQQQNVQTLLDALQDGVMDSMADPTGKNLAPYGLDHPAASVELTWKDGEGTLEIGRKKGSTEYYARNSQSPAVFVLNNYLFDDMNTIVHPPKAKGKG